MPPRSIGQKVREALLAVKLESEQTKDQILATYLNTIYFGHGAYGIQAASKTYFGVGEDQLTVAQAALLAGLVRSPGFYDPAVKGNEKVAKDRRNYVLDQMVENGWLDATQATTLKSQKIQLHLAPDTFNTPGDSEYFVEYTKHQLTERYGGAKVFGGGLRVTTTIDLALQRDAEAAVQQHLPTPGDPAAAVVTIDAQTGQILAMVGGKNFARSQVNLATGEGGTGRQAGSAFKPFTLAAAMADGYDLRKYWSGTSPITIPDKECYTDGKPWTLSNASDEESGTFTLKDATAYSVNTVFAQVIAQLGPDRVVDMAHRLGIRSHLESVCSVTLGTQAVNPLEMTNAYGTLADRGVLTRATPLISVERPAQAAGADHVRQGPQPAAAAGAPAERRRPRHVGVAGRRRLRHGDGGRHRAAGGRQDRHGPGLRGRVVLRVPAGAGGPRGRAGRVRRGAAARHLRVGRLPQGRDPHEQRRGRVAGLRRHDPGRDLARLHAEGRRPPGHRSDRVPDPVERGPRQGAGDAGARAVLADRDAEPDRHAEPDRRRPARPTRRARPTHRRPPTRRRPPSGRWAPCGCAAPRPARTRAPAWCRSAASP